MIEVEFRRPAASGYEAVGVLRVEDDGSYRVSGDIGVDLEGVTIMDRSAPGGRLALADDPATWARKARRAFRTGYLVPVVVADTSPGGERADGEGLSDG